MPRPVRFDQLKPLWLHHLPGEPDGAMLVQLRQAAREFCERTDIWAVELDPIDLVAEQAQYTLVWSTPCEIVKVVSIEFDPSTTELTDGFSFIMPETIELSESNTPTADDTDGLIVNVVMKPSLLSAELPPVLASWGEYIVAKAIYDLKIQPDKPWTDLAGAPAHLSQWTSGLNRAMSRVAAAGTEANRL